jgi:hypothetical protein
VNLAGPSITIDPLVAAPLAAAGGAVRLVAIPAHEYRVTSDHQLRRDGRLLAQDVEDLQFALYLDLDGDAQIDADEMRGTDAGIDDFSAQGTDISVLREVRMNLVVRTRAEDDEFVGQLQAMENRADGAADGFRRRVYTTTIMPRNMGRRFGS